VSTVTVREDLKPAGRWRLGLRVGQVCVITGGYVARVGAAYAVRLVTLGRWGRGRPAPWLVAVPSLLTALGPFAVKAGQLLSTRRDLLPQHVCAILARLTDDVPPPREAALVKQVHAVYGSPESWPFASVEWTPVASGSIATVHRAHLRDGSVVALKLRRPAARLTMELDYRLARAGARFMGRLPKLRKMPMLEMITQVGGAVLAQADFSQERVALHRLRDNLADMPSVRIPRVWDALSTDRTVVMEFLSGLGPFTPEAHTPEERRRIVRDVLRAVYRMLFLDGLVHCDLHPGNLYLSDDGKITILDAGFVVQLPPRVRYLFASFFLNMAVGQGRRCADITIESAALVPEDCDLDGFRDKLEELVDEVSGALSKDFNLADFAPRLFKLQQSFGLYAAAEFAFPLLSLLVIEGMITGFDPEVDFQAEAMPVLNQATILLADAEMQAS
jgi:ubiquinone biosynthesis protein